MLAEGQNVKGYPHQHVELDATAFNLAYLRWRSSASKIRMVFEWKVQGSLKDSKAYQ